MWQVLRIQGFIAFLTLAFLNAFVDLGHKIIIQNTILKTYDGDAQVILTAIVNGLILLPFILLFTPAGFLADKWPKNKIMRFSAWGAVVLTSLITLSYYQGWFWFGFAMTFLLATQSAFYSPAKYGYIKEIVGDKKLPQGNALVQSISMIAILLGMFVFSIFFESFLSGQNFETKEEVLTLIAPLGWALVGLSLFETFMAYRVPQQQHEKTDRVFDWKRYLTGKSGAADIKLIWNNPVIWLSIIGLAIFWSLSQATLATYPSFIENNFSTNNTLVIQGILAAAGIGIMIGSTLASRYSRDYIETGLIPIGAIGVFITVTLVTLIDSLFLQALNFLMWGVMGGLFVVPLNALMQYHTEDHELGRVIASNNLIQNISMGTALLLTIALFYMGIAEVHFFYVLSAVALAGALYTILRLPQSLLRFVATVFFRARYRLRVINFENLPSSGGVLLLGNHISWIDWAVVQMASPRPLHFIVEDGYLERWHLQWLTKRLGAIGIQNSSKEKSMEKVTELLKQGEVVCLFPEASISRIGQLSEFSNDFEKVAQDSQAQIVPFYLHGLWGSRFSRSSGFLRESRQSGFKRDIVVSFGKPLPSTTNAKRIKQNIFDLSFTSWHAYSEQMESIPTTWLRAAKRFSFRLAAADVLGEPINHHRMMVGVFRFADLIKQRNPEQNVGIVLPTSVGCAIANMAVLTLGKTVVNLNYTSSQDALRSAAKQSNLKRIFTSKLFVKRLKERNIDIETIFEGYELIYLETLKASIPKWKLLTTLLTVMLLPERLLRAIYIKKVDLEDTIAILFSSGSEGAPKGIELSHRNVAANARQIADTLNTHEDDVIMGTLPSFHAFGLTACTLMPMSEGIPVICHPDPTDGLNIARGIARYDATLLLGTSTFFRLYARNPRIHPLMFKSLKFIVAGAEKLTPEARKLFTERFGKTIYEGYGATETSPVACVNFPDQIDTITWQAQQAHRVGTVGLPIVGTSLRIVDPETLEELPIGEDGLILIGGPQIMKGYLNNPEKTDSVISVLDGQRWYHTGDKGHVDEDGFLTIVDRYSRFAKLGGEMVSLTAVESTIRQAMEEEELDLVAMNLPDAKKGEKVIILVSEEYDHAAIKPCLLEKQINPLMIPAAVYSVPEVPKLGTGKTDFSASRALAIECEAHKRKKAS